MAQLGESAFVAVEPEEPKEDEQQEEKSVKIRFSLFFDGTCNNRINTDQRVKSIDLNIPEEERKKAQEIFEKYKSSASYENDYTNVAKMEKYVKTGNKIDDDKVYDITLKTYVEGPGTEDYEGDSKLGYGLGMGPTGVREKVKSGLKSVINKISKSHQDKATTIELLTLDVFGFSRGAAGARNFIYEAINGDKLEPVKVELEKLGYQLDKVEVDFAGLYDTVSSHGFMYYNDVSDLKLRAVSHAKRTIHLAAADEHRKNFSLTTIQSAKASTRREIFLPGVHSDIGGSYVDNAKEEQIIFYGSERAAIEDRKQLIASGWYQEHELTLIPIPSVDLYSPAMAMLEAKRASLSNQYARIPLHVMVDFAQENSIVIRPKIQRDEEIPSDLSDIHTTIDSYAKKTRSSKVTDWHHNSDELKALRNKYLHFSAKCEFGLAPRFKDGRRYRKEYAG